MIPPNPTSPQKPREFWVYKHYAQTASAGNAPLSVTDDPIVFIAACGNFKTERIHVREVLGEGPKPPEGAVRETAIAVVTAFGEARRHHDAAMTGDLYEAIEDLHASLSPKPEGEAG